MRRLRWLLVCLVAAGAIAVGLTVSSGSGSTPRQLVVTAAVTRRTLEDKVTLSGTLSRVEQRKVSATTAAQVSAVHIDDGAVVQTGQPMLAVNGRDAVAEQGSFPFFRSLDVGDSGPDVLQLNQILASTGFNVGAVGPLYTEQTRFALAQWQAAHGYPGVAPQKPQTVTVSLAQSGAYKVGPRGTAAVTIGPSAPVKTAARTGPPAPATLAARVGPPAAVTVGARTGPPAGAVLLAAVNAPATPELTVYAVGAQTPKGQPATFIVYASSAPASALTFSVSTGGSATTNDALPPTGPFVIQAGATSAQVQVPTRLNGVVEPNQTLTLSLVAGSGYTVGAPGSATTTIVSNDVPKLTVSGGGAVSPGDTATVLVSADQPPVQDTEVDVQVGGDATPSKDYQQIASTYILHAGQSQLAITVPTLVNEVLQPDRHVVVSLVPGTAYAIGAVKSATVTILGPVGAAALPVVSLETGTHQLNKGQPFAITIGLSRALTTSLDVALAYAGTAVQGVDYTPPNVQLTVPPGQTSLVVQVPTIADNRVEPDTVLFVSLVPSSAYVVGTANAVATKIVSQNLPELSIIAAAPSVAAGAATSFTITADQAPAKDTSVQFQAVGTAVPGQDYQALTGTAVLPAGQTSVNVMLRTINRNVVFEPLDMIVASWPVRVGQVLVKEGDLVQPGVPLMSLTDTAFTVTLQASASDRTRLKVGDQATVKLSGGDAQATGVISEIDDNITTDPTTKAQVYKGKITVGNLGAADGATVSIDVVVQEKANVLTVPIAAVKQNGSGQDVVRVIDLAHGGRVDEVNVKTGLSVDDFIEVESGLRGDEVVIVETSKTKG
ncbi:MAG TPA: Calx-beta domain-containing protein [Acidimicrobiales bacterium]|nr:Calx-beta domain-containing protein [Acidimicrobiales bacterium]